MMRFFFVKKTYIITKIVHEECFTKINRNLQETVKNICILIDIIFYRVTSFWTSVTL